MKKLYFLVVLFVVGSVYGQNIDFPDTALKTRLVHIGTIMSPYVATNLEGEEFKIDANHDGEIDVLEALQVKTLIIPGVVGTDIVNLKGLEYFTSLTELNIYGNAVAGYWDVSELIHLEELNCANNQLTGINLNGLIHLKSLSCQMNQITTLNLNGLPSLESLSCSSNLMTVLDATPLTNLKTLYCGSNSLTNLNIIGLSNLEILSFSNSPIESVDLSGLSNIKKITALLTNLSALDVSGLSTLTELDCRSNNIQTLNLEGAIALTKLNCDTNELTSLDLSGLVSLNYVNCMHNQLTTFNISSLTQPVTCQVGENPLQTAFIKNGADNFLGLTGVTTLEYICADEEEVLNMYVEGCEINSFCTFGADGIFYEINGNTSIDSDSNGCDASDSILPNLKLFMMSGWLYSAVIANETGEYAIHVDADTYTLTPHLENPEYFTVSPETVSVTFPATETPFTQNFCISPNGLHPDLEVVLMPISPARPGFDAVYRIMIKNKGNIQQSGSVSFAYNDAVLDYITAVPAFTTQAEGVLSWSFDNLKPFETREIDVTLNLNSPAESPALNADDVLSYTVNITSNQVDDMPLDNTFTLPQLVVNSFDPNDKTCLEGISITPNKIGEYVHYMIRFENTGTSVAQHIYIKDVIDYFKLDMWSLVPLSSSHSFTTRVSVSKVDFIFENINLPFDDANNDGYIMFKIKTLPDLVEGDSISNTASIYFDYNHPIVTEPAVFTFAELGTKDFEFNSYLTLYPNPTNGILNITTKEAIELQSISIYNMLGQMVVSVPNAKGISTVDVSSLSTGNYFIKVVSDKGTSNSKFIKQ